jgi:ABC-2 type transport system ATP-binding protein
MADQGVIQTQNLGKTYKSESGPVIGLEGLDLTVYRGEIFGYLGPNGAGKTTTIRMLLDLIRPTEGSATILGLDAQRDSLELRARIGFLPGELSLWRNLTGIQVIRYLAKLRGLTDLSYAEELARRLKLDTSRRVRDYSSGNRRKLGLVIALMSRPELLILDEPTGGLDPLMQQEFNALMREARAEGRTVFLSSHILGEVQAICDRVGILRDGQLKAVEQVEGLTHVDFRWVQFRFRDAILPEWQAQIEALDNVHNVNVNERVLRLQLHGDFDPLLRIVSDGYIEDIRVEEPTLEEIFLTFYGNNDDEVQQSEPGDERVQEVVR